MNSISLLDKEAVQVLFPIIQFRLHFSMNLSIPSKYSHFLAYIVHSNLSLSF